MNGHFDINNRGDFNSFYDDLPKIALAKNTHKFVLNFRDENLRTEYERVESLGNAKK